MSSIIFIRTVYLLRRFIYNIEKIIEELKNNDEFRFKHSIGVMETAIELSELYDADVERMKVAAFLHDYAKMYSIVLNL